MKKPNEKKVFDNNKLNILNHSFCMNLEVYG